MVFFISQCDWGIKFAQGLNSKFKFELDLKIGRKSNKKGEKMVNDAWAESPGAAHSFSLYAHDHDSVKPQRAADLTGGPPW